MGISDAGSVGTTIRNVSVIDAARGLQLAKEPVNAGIPATSMMTTNTLVAGFQSVAFFAGGETVWMFDHCAAVGGYPSAANVFNPDDPDASRR